MPTSYPHNTNTNTIKDTNASRINSDYPLVIGLSGKIGSGKDYCANMMMNILSSDCHVAIHAFADYLKIMCHIEYDIPYERLFRTKDTESRTALQRVGTQARIDDPKVFIRALDCQLRLAKDRKVEVVLIPDVRMMNELEYILSIGGRVIRIDAVNRNLDKIQQEVSHLPLVERESASARISSHVSETNLDHETRFYRHINNDYGYERDVLVHMVEMLESLFILPVRRLESTADDETKVSSFPPSLAVQRADVVEKFDRLLGRYNAVKKFRVSLEAQGGDISVLCRELAELEILLDNVTNGLPSFYGDLFKRKYQ
jgi:hypothetical protein